MNLPPKVAIGLVALCPSWFFAAEKSIENKLSDLPYASYS